MKNIVLWWGEQLKAINLKEPTILLEPFGRDTAPAIALTALYLADSNPDALMLVMPADQNIVDIPAFCALKGACKPSTIVKCIDRGVGTTLLSWVRAFK